MRKKREMQAGREKDGESEIEKERETHKLHSFDSYVAWCNHKGSVKMSSMPA